MQRAISTNKLYITGTETDENTVSIETITTVLSGIQKTAYLLASAKHKQPIQKRFTPNKDIKQRYALQCGVPKQGSYLIPIAQLPSNGLLEEDDILADMNVCSGQVKPDTFKRESSKLMGNKSPLAECNLVWL